MCHLEIIKYCHLLMLKFLWAKTFKRKGVRKTFVKVIAQLEKVATGFYKCMTY